MTSSQTSVKSFVVAWVYALFFGLFGADRFYLGKPLQGVAKFLTFGGLGAWQLFNLFSILSGSEKGPEGLPLKGSEQHTLTLWIVTAGIFLIQVMSSLFLLSLITGSASANDSIFFFLP
jgi:hypothetical protein